MIVYTNISRKFNILDLVSFRYDINLVAVRQHIAYEVHIESARHIENLDRDLYHKSVLKLSTLFIFALSGFESPPFFYINKKTDAICSLLVRQ